MSFLTEANNEPVLDEHGREIVHFSNDQYAQVFKDSRDPAASIAGWEFLTSVGTIDLYRRKHSGSSLYEYQAVGVFEDVHGKLFHDSYLDIVFQAEISQFIFESNYPRGSPGPCHLCVKFPFPLSDREYTLYRESRHVKLDSGEEVFIILMEHIDLPEVSTKRGIVRVKSNLSKIVIEMDPNNPTNPKLYIKLFEDPNGSIPPWVINYGAKLAMPTYMKEIRKGTKKYAKSRESRNLPPDAPYPPELPTHLIADHRHPMPPKPHRDAAKLRPHRPQPTHRRSLSLESHTELTPAPTPSRRSSAGSRAGLAGDRRVGAPLHRTTSSSNVSQVTCPYPFPPVMEARWDFQHWRSSQPVTPETVIYWLQGCSGIPEHEQGAIGPALQNGLPSPETGVFDSLTSSLALSLSRDGHVWRV
eukprot:m.259203 g.259203  ORF g.259203 m.259203 type:complete len:415 (+) comp17585_c0_seq4:112-1356(+)